MEDRQDIDVGAYSTEIDLGEVEAEFSLWFRNYANQNDYGRIALEAYSDAGTIDETTFLGRWQSAAEWHANDPAAWAQYVTNVYLPIGTRALRVMMEGYRGAGANLDAYMDDLELILDTPGRKRVEVPITNPGIDPTDTNGWSASNIRVDNTQHNVISPPCGNYFRGETSVASGYLEQTIDVPAGITGVIDDYGQSSYVESTPVGNEEIIFLFDYLGGSYENKDKLQIIISFLDAASASIGTLSGTDEWHGRNWKYIQLSVVPPQGTRKIKIRANFTRAAGADLDSSICALQAYFTTIEELSGLSIGNTGDQLSIILDSISYERQQTSDHLVPDGVGDLLPIIQDSIEATLAGNIEHSLGDILRVVLDGITYDREPGLGVGLSDALPIIQDNISWGMINIGKFGRWVAPLKITPLVSEIDPMYFAAHPVRHPEFYFEPKVKSYGTFTRAISAPPGFIRSGDVEVRVIDADNSIRQRLGTKTIQDAIAELRLGPEDGPYSAFLRPWRRRVGLVSQPADGELSFKMQDFVFKYLERPVPNVITEENFANLPENSAGQFANLIIGSVSSDGGALNCPLVDPDNYYYLVSRHPSSVSGVYRKADDSDEFELVDPGEYSIKTDVYVIHEFGVGDYCTIVNFGSDQAGKQIRANASGNTTLTNFADCIHAIFLYLAWALDQGEILNTASFADTALLVADLECAGAWTKPVTFGEALTQLQRSSNIDVFADKDDRIKVKYTADDEEAKLNLSDLLRLYKGTISQSIADPAKNRIPYEFCPNYAANTWKQGTFDNETDQDKIGRTDAEETLKMYFVREAATALTVVERRAQYLDLDSFRIEGEIPLVPVLEEIELADIVSVDHFGGIKVGGYSGVQFKLTELSMDIDNLKYSFKAIRRRLPPAEFVETYQTTGNGGDIGGGTLDDDGIAIKSRRGIIAGLSAINARVGPYYNGYEGELFAVFRHTSGKRLMAWYTQNNGVTWVERDIANAPAAVNSIYSFDVCQSGRELLVASQESSTGRVSFHVFNMDLLRWTTIDDEVEPTTIPLPGSNAFCVSIECRYPSGEPVIYYQGPRANVGGIYYRRGYYSMLQEGIWTAPLAATHAPATNCDIQRVMPGRENRMHFFYELDPADRGVTWSPDDWVRSMDSARAFGGGVILYRSAIYYPAERNIGNAILISDRTKILMTRKMAMVGASALTMVNEGYPVSFNKQGTFSDYIVGEGGGYSHNPAAFLGMDPVTDRIYFATAAWSTPSYIRVRESANDGSTWTSGLRAGPTNADRVSMEELKGNVFRIRSKTYLSYFTSEYGRTFPVFRWFNVDQLPYS